MVCFLVVSATVVSAQRNSKTRGLKIYTGIDYKETEDQVVRIQDFDMGLSVAYFQEGTKWMQEYELTRLRYESRDEIYDPDASTFDINNFNSLLELGLQYSISKNLIRSDRSSIYVGLGAEIHYQRAYLEPRRFLTFPITVNNVFFDPKLIIRYNYRISDVLSLDFYLPLTITSLARESDFIDNPFIQLSQQSQIFYTNDWLGTGIQFKLGVAVLLQRGHTSGSGKQKGKRRKSRRKK